jgi:chromosome partitioning protein
MVRPVADLAPLYDLIIIDTPPAVASEAPWAALQISDLALIPFVPTAADMWAKEARVLARKAMEQNPDIRGVHHLPSMVRRGNTIAGVLDQFRSDPEVALLSSTVSLLNAYLDSQMLGLCVGQLSSSSTAAKEMSALSDEVLGLLGLSKSVEGKRKGKR